MIVAASPIVDAGVSVEGSRVMISLTFMKNYLPVYFSDREVAGSRPGTGTPRL